MPGLSSSLNIGLSGLQAAQSALSTVGHNIANVNTPGFSRQRVTLQPSISQGYGALQFGTGVSLTKVIGMRDRFLDLQVTQSVSKERGSNTRYQGVEGASTVFLEEGETGMNMQIQKFFQGFQELSLRPEDMTLRSNLLGRASSMINGLQTRYRMLDDARNNADRALGSLVTEVNSLTKQISSLNLRILGENSSGSDSDARDQRKILLDELAKKIGIQVFEDDRGQVQVSLDSGAATLVSGSTSYALSTQPDPAMQGHLRVWSGLNTGAPLDVTTRIQEGEVGANLDLRDNILAGYQRRMDELAAGIARNLNQAHRAGFGLGGQTGNDFFLAASGNDANGLPNTVSAATNYRGMVHALQINAALQNDPGAIAAANAPGAAGNNLQARLMGDLYNQANTVDTNGDGVGDAGPFHSVVAGLANRMGTDAQDFRIRSTNAENLVTALENQRESISGVDLDEEATALLTYQRGYQAASRFIGVIAQLTDQLVNQFGR